MRSEEDTDLLCIWILYSGFMVISFLFFIGPTLFYLAHNLFLIIDYISNLIYFLFWLVLYSAPLWLTLWFIGHYLQKKKQIERVAGCIYPLIRDIDNMIYQVNQLVSAEVMTEIGILTEGETRLKLERDLIEIYRLIASLNREQTEVIVKLKERNRPDILHVYRELRRLKDETLWLMKFTNEFKGNVWMLEKKSALVLIS